MKISFNPAYNYKMPSFKEDSKDAKPVQTYTEKEIRIAKTKKAVSECATIVLGVGILYFAMKRNFKVNRIKNHEKKMKELAGFVPPKLKLDVNHVDEFLKV